MIKQQIIEYRNTHVETRTALGTVLGELDRITKDPTDEQCCQVIKKMMESNLETGMLEENKLLEQFLPKQLTERQIQHFMSDNIFRSIGECMKFFKENFAGLYDGKIVSRIFNEHIGYLES